MTCETCKTTTVGKHCAECGTKREPTLQESVVQILREHKLIPDEKKDDDKDDDQDDPSLLDNVLGRGGKKKGKDSPDGEKK